MPMRPSFHPRMINDVFSDPGLFIPFLFEKRALLFDLGSLRPLSPGDLLKISHVFVTHTHMDHFVGFDDLIRIFLGREKELHIFGPPDFFSRVEGKLGGYTWNLVNEYENTFNLKITEVHQKKCLTRTYECRNHFRSKGIESEDLFSGTLLREPSFYVDAALLDHRIPCLGLSLVENFYVNIMKEGLRKHGLTVGPWINRFKRALYEKEPPDTEFSVTWEEKGVVVKKKTFPLGELAGEIARTSPGQKVTYITDAIGSPENMERMIALAKGSDHLFVEAAFMDIDKETAKKKAPSHRKGSWYPRQKGGSKAVYRFSFFPRYSHRAQDVEKEAMDAYLSG